MLLVALALAWVVAAVQVTATEGVAPTAQPTLSASSHQHDHAMPAMIGCCETLMPESCAISGMAHCTSGAGGLSFTDNMLAGPTIEGPSGSYREVPLAALALASDPPPPRI